MSQTPRVIMYCRSWCGDCRRARQWLDAHDIAYEEVDVEEDAEACARAAGHNSGRLHTPTFEIGGGVCVDFDPERLADLLGMR
jgi:mycoredoxin